MKRKFLEDLGLTKEQIDSIMDENGKDVNAAKGELEQTKSELGKVKEQLADRDKQLEDLKASSGDNEELKKQITDLQEQNKQKDKDHQEEIKALKLDNAIRNAIGETAQDAELVGGLIDKSKLILSDDGKVTGLDEQIKALKTSKAFLFKPDEGGNPNGGQPGFHPVGAPQGRNPGGNPGGTKDQPVDMKAAITAKLQAALSKGE